jgi:hypothetical protein
VAVRSVQNCYVREFSVLHMLRDFFLMAHRKCDDSVFACKLSVTAMIFPFGVQFHAEQQLLVWRPRGLLDEKVVSDIIAAVGQLCMNLLIDSRIQWESNKLISTTSMSSA